MFAELWESIAPSLVELIMSVVTLILGYLAMKVRGWLKVETDARYLEMEEKHMRALHSAIRSGVLDLMDDGDIDKDKLVAGAIAYAKESVPDAMDFLLPSDGVLAKLAKSKITELIR